ncbi:MAG: oligopeptide:H+ symporter [Thermoguttaceae bacterium]
MKQENKQEVLNEMLDQEPDRGYVNVPSTEFPKKHPAGLWVLFTTEMWERFCYYGMRAFLTLYIYSAATAPNNPGFGWSQSEAYQFYGYFTGLVYLMPLLCGWIADYFIGQHRSMLFGGILIALGEFCLCATEFVRAGGGIAVTLKTDPLALYTFFGGLALIIIGTGFFKPCVSVMVGQLYGEGDPRRDGGFTIFYMGINLGAFFSPLIAGTIAETIGWEWGFFTAGVGMVFGLLTYTLLRPKYLADLGLPPKKMNFNAELTPEERKKAEQLEYERTRPLTRADLDRVFVILAMSIFTIAFWLSFEQAGSSLNVFAKQSTNREIPGSSSIPAVVRNNVFIENEFNDDMSQSVREVELVAEEIAAIRSPEGETVAKTPPTRITPFGKLARFFGSFFGHKKEDGQSGEEQNESDDKAKRREERVVRLFKEAEKLCQPYKLVVNSAGQLVIETRTGEEIVPQENAVKENAPKENSVVETTTTQKGNEEPGDESATEQVETAKGRVETRELGLSEEELAKLTPLLEEYSTAVSNLEKTVNRVQQRYKSGQTLYTFPATWYQSVNALGIVLFAPLFAFLWIFLESRRLQPSTPVKFGIGLLLVALSFIVMIPGAIEAKQSPIGLAAPFWLILSYLLATWGELCLSPVGLSMVSKLAPIRFASLLMGFWFISSAIANYLGGYLAAIFGSESSDGTLGIELVFGKTGGLADFFLLMALIPALAGIIVLAAAPSLKRMMHGKG